jgi:hypothetical protein
LDFNLAVGSLAATSLIVNRDGVNLGHNFFMFWQSVNDSGFAVTYDMDRSLGQGDLPFYGFDWPINFCAPFVFWCGHLLSLFHEQYVNLLRELAEQYVQQGHMAADLSVLQVT